MNTKLLFILFFVVLFLVWGMLKIVIYISGGNYLYVFAFAFGVITILFLYDVVNYFKEKKNKVVLEKILGDIAKTHYKNKYNKNIEVFKVELFLNQYLFVKRYTNSGIVYLGENKSKRVVITLDSNFHLTNIKDNLINNKSWDLENRLRAVLKKFDVS